MIVAYDSSLIVVDERCRCCGKVLLDGELLAALGPDGPERVCLPCLACDDPTMTQPGLVLSRNFVSALHARDV